MRQVGDFRRFSLSRSKIFTKNLLPPVNSWSSQNFRSFSKIRGGAGFWWKSWNLQSTGVPIRDFFEFYHYLISETLSTQPQHTPFSADLKDPFVRFIIIHSSFIHHHHHDKLLRSRSHKWLVPSHYTTTTSGGRGVVVKKIIIINN